MQTIKSVKLNELPEPLQVAAKFRAIKIGFSQKEISKVWFGLASDGHIYSISESRLFSKEVPLPYKNYII